jgi:ABC-2 type transport system permease protein
MAEFQKIIDHRGVVAVSALYPLAHLGLARAAALVGDTAKSRKAYEDDGQQMQCPLTMLLLLAPLASILVWRRPDSSLATSVSLFPFFSLFPMFLRIASQPPAKWQIVLSILLMIVAILGATWLAAKVYRVGLLMYGKRLTLTDISKCLRNS